MCMPAPYLQVGTKRSMWCPDQELQPSPAPELTVTLIAKPAQKRILWGSLEVGTRSGGAVLPYIRGTNCTCTSEKSYTYTPEYMDVRGIIAGVVC